MEVLTCADVQYAGESSCPQRSPGAKSSGDVLKENTIFHEVECPREKSEDDLSLDIRKAEQLLLEVNSAQPMACDDQSNDPSEEQGSLLHVDCTLQKSSDDIFDDVFGGGETLQKIERIRKREGDELSNSISEEKGKFLRMDSPEKGSDLLNDKECTILKDNEITQEGNNSVRSVELLPCSNFLFAEETNCCEQVQMPHCVPKVDGSVLNAEEAQRNEASEFTPASDTFHDEISYVEHKEQELLPCNLHGLSGSIPKSNDTELGILDVHKQNGELIPDTVNSYPLTSKKEAAPLNGKQEGEDCLQGTECPDEDDTLALWVKWRGKWQPGIRCPRADWPLSTVKAKPTHGRKKYIVVFFPHTRSHSWADALLVRSISEFPEPLAYGSHYSGLELVKDLTVPRRYIMQKLAVGMLNVSDQLHTEAVIESARQVTAWKEFAMEACGCEGYSDLGRMLLKLQTMILPDYIDPNWLEHSFGSWVERCEKAQSAESVEILTKELVDSVLWDEVELLWDAPVQPVLGSDWKMWKHEVMKWFLTSHPVASSGETEQRGFDDSASAGTHISRKRPKLEVRRAEMHGSRVEVESHGFCSQANNIETDSRFFNSQLVENSEMACGPPKEESLTTVAPPIGAPGSVLDRWDEIVVEPRNLEFNHSAEAASTPKQEGNCGKTLIDVQEGSRSEKKYRQCMAFIEAKGRQCGRWASDGDIYCCVHLVHMTARTVDEAAKVEQSPLSVGPMCEGTTTHGTKCKHRSRNGSLFCKKHQLQGSGEIVHIETSSISPENQSKRELNEKNDTLEKISEPGTVSSKEIVLLGGQNPIQENLGLTTEGEMLDARNSFVEKCEQSCSSIPVEDNSQELPRCIIWCRLNNNQCLERAKTHTLYCEIHLPAFLKRARNGKSRIISKDVFLDLLRGCNARKQKVHLHRACELLYGFMKSALSRRNVVSRESLMEWILSEASKDLSIGEFLLKLVSHEREKIGKLWGLDAAKDKEISSVSEPVPMLEAKENNHDVQTTVTIKCKICSEKFSDDQALGVHWMDIHKKEAQWLFRGYACAICSNSFTNRKVLEAHAKERHNLQFLEQCLLFQCMPCGSHFMNPEQLWLHVLSLHAMDFRLRMNSEQQNHNENIATQPNLDLDNKAPANSDATDNHSESQDISRKFVCRFCGLKFDLLPDLGRHHQAAHMNSSSSHFPARKRNRLSGAKLKPGRPGHTRFKKGLGTALRIRNAAGFGMKKHFQTSNPVRSAGVILQTQASGTVGLGKPVESHCSAVAEILFTEIQKTKQRPSNPEILSIARSTCCKTGLYTTLEEKYGVLPERLFLKAAKLCSELSIHVEWHIEGFICPKGCKALVRPNTLAPLVPLQDGFMKPAPASSASLLTGGEWEMDEAHYIIGSTHLKQTPKRVIVLCEDVSFGREPVPVACVVDENLRGSVDSDEESNGQNCCISMPWKDFNYVTERLLDPSLGLDTKSSQLGCGCPHPSCRPETCDHVYLFDNDYENAEDIHGKSMHGRFPYDMKGRIILEEGYLVYECNSMCSCDKTCRNRVLQNGVQVKLEVFKSEKKGWAVRAGEAIVRGTFVCEYIGEVLNDQEANKRGERYDNKGCSYLYDINAHIDDASGLNEGAVPYIIDATKYGNVSRFINHSCSPNLVNYQVLVESMDCQLAHIGLYANRDIAKGEELAYDYRYKLLPGEGCPCHCGASNCRGRLY